MRNATVTGGRVQVNKKSEFNLNTFLAAKANFNGMQMLGKGKITIDKTFHSRMECLMLTQNHNYNNGSKIPYDDTYCIKEIIISDNLWICSRVIILGGVKINENAIIQAGML